MQLNFKQAIELLQSQVDWDSFFALRSVMAGELNKPSERFFKSGIIERGLCSYSNGTLIYIDETGRDCQFVDYPRFFLEVKGNQANWHLKNFACFRLVNGNSKTKVYDKIPETYAQFYLFHNLSNAFLCETGVLNRYLINVGSGNIDVAVPTSKMTLLGKKTKPFNKKVSRLSSYIDAALEEFYVSIKNLQ